MKKLFVFLTMVLSVGFAEAQNSWNIILHKKVLLSGKEADEGKNVKLVRSSDWKKSGYLEVYFKEKPASPWKHSIRFTDEQGNELLVKENVLSAKISTASLRRIFAGKKQIKIYMVIAPSDPNLMAPARMIHLATLKLP